MATPPGLPRPAFSYNFAAVQCIIGTVSISNYGADGSIEFEFPSQIAESEVSADGYVTYVANSDERVRVRIRVAENSGVLALLQNFIRTQVQASFQGAPVPFLNFRFFCPSTGDAVNSQYAVFLNEPTPSKSKALGTREFLLELPDARFRIQQGLLNVVTQ